MLRMKRTRHSRAPHATKSEGVTLGSKTTVAILPPSAADHSGPRGGSQNAAQRSSILPPPDLRTLFADAVLRLHFNGAGLQDQSDPSRTSSNRGQTSVSDPLDPLCLHFAAY